MGRYPRLEIGVKNRYFSNEQGRTNSDECRAIMRRGGRKALDFRMAIR
jgi:hypothetical protein